MTPCMRATVRKHVARLSLRATGGKKHSINPQPNTPMSDAELLARALRAVLDYPNNTEARDYAFKVLREYEEMAKDKAKHRAK